MGLSDIFSQSTFITLGLVILLIGLVAVFFMQRINEQNHKITSMFGIVTTMADELQFVRSRVQVLSLGNNVGGAVGNSLNTEVNAISNENTNSLIPVSDEDDEDDDEDDEDDEDDSDSDDEEDSEDGDDDEGSEEDDADDNNSNKDVKSHMNDIKTINMGETLDLNIHCETLNETNDEENSQTSDLGSEEEELESLNTEDENDIDNNDDNDDNDNDNSNQGNEQESSDNLAVVSSDHLVNEILTNSSFIKAIDISGLDESTNVENYDYKKLSLNKLKSIVTEKGLSQNPHKLKKPELLKLLGVE